jgi:hypothetical protein
VSTSKADWLVKSLAVVTVLFGLLTVLSGGRTLFGGEAARLAAGAIVPFVLWFKNVDFSNWMADVSAPLPALGSTPVTSKTTGTDRPASPCATAKGRRRLTDIDATAAGPALAGVATTSKPSIPEAATR